MYMVIISCGLYLPLPSDAHDAAKALLTLAGCAAGGACKTTNVKPPNKVGLCDGVRSQCPHAQNCPGMPALLSSGIRRDEQLS